MVIRYDGRGHGLSDRDVADHSLDARMQDLEAVVDRLDLERFALLGLLHSGPVAIAYTARNSERVSHLALWAAYARGGDYLASGSIQTLRGLLTQNWELYTETVAHALLGWSAGEAARQFAALMRDSVTPEGAQVATAISNEFDVTDFLPRVKCPTLVFHRRQAPLPGIDVARGLASRIPDARLAVLEGASLATFLDDWEAVVRAIDEFLSEGEEATVGAEPPDAAHVHTILFTDVEASTALTQRLGDARAREVLREHERIVREALKAHGGAEVKTMGDGFMVSFGSATRALECSIAMQRAFAAHNESAEEPVLVRVGLNAGEPIEEDEDLFGTAVIRAARIAATAQGGEILVANVVRELAEGKEFMFADRGEVALRGFDDPVRLFAVRWEPAA